MARPPLPIGTYGAIRTEQVGPNRFRARTRFRDYDGKTRDVEATDVSSPAAIRALKVKLRDRAIPNDDEISRDTRASSLSEKWIEELTDEERIAPQTIDRYRGTLRTAILPALGELRIREVTVGRLDRFLREIAKNHPSKAKGAKVALSQMFALAVRHGAIPTNPVRDTGRLRKPRREVTALETKQLETVRTAIRTWQEPVPGKPGPRHTGDLADIIDLMLATGARIGEILAVRWSDLDLSKSRPVLTISGTLVYVKGRGVFRQGWTKSEAGYRTIVLPGFAVGMLLARKLTAAENEHDAVFASRNGTWLQPNNVRRQWRQARADTDLTWVTPHTFRKTVATLIDEEANTKSAAAQLGHGSEEVTATYYIAKPAIAPDNSEILERLGADRTAAKSPARNREQRAE
ncbi:integrase [Actinoplanes lutulentus]|uniref:Site-specific recombinase XerD n=1 Tax=Actinoplanes lutulentus TaxID=1287878 RepID=A0A327Z2M4_9ACTN|nr:site-specific integrase [Actinoplanes lutulentus]MBB2943212.1 integrase [Actinoplanes lutulentus]RAK28278.1 site-specific recombinase XerD [Actinoplanes lutulentus]